MDHETKPRARPPKAKGLELLGGGCGILVTIWLSLFIIFFIIVPEFDRSFGPIFVTCTIVSSAAAWFYWLWPGPTPEEVALWEEEERQRRSREQGTAELAASARFAVCPNCACNVQGTQILQCIGCGIVFCTRCGSHGGCPRRSCGFEETGILDSHWSSYPTKWLGRIS
jgi:hypothetical protein